MPGNKSIEQSIACLVKAQRNSKGPDGAEVRGHPVSESHKYAAAQHALSVHAQDHTALDCCIQYGLKVWPVQYLASYLGGRNQSSMKVGSSDHRTKSRVRPIQSR